MSVMKKKEIKVGSRYYKVNAEFYDSAEELVMTSTKRNNTDSRFHDYQTYRVSMDFEGVHSYSEALYHLKNGYQPTVDELRESFKCGTTGSEKRIKFFNDVAGFMPVVPLALKNVPNSMINSKMKAIKCKVIDVYYDMTCSCGTTVQEIIKCGQKMLGAIIDLEKQGYRFNLYAVQSYTDEYSADMLCVKVKSSDRQIDLKRISFPLTHPGFFRCIGFDWYGKFPLGKYRSGYGHALAYEISDHKNFGKQMFGDNAIYFLATNIKYEDVAHIKEVLTNDKRN